ncbi:fimbrial protein, partial [Providencia rustigianii]
TIRSQNPRVIFTEELILINHKIKLAIFLSLMFSSFLANALCSVVGTGINRAPVTYLGPIDPIAIYGLQFQPKGTPLSLSYISGTQLSISNGLNPETVLFRCNAADANQIFEGYYLFRADNAHLASAQIVNGITYWAIWVVGAVSPRTPVSGVDYEFFLGNGINVGNAFGNEPNWTKRMAYEVDPTNSNFIIIKGKHFSGFTNSQIRSGIAVTASNFNPVIPQQLKGFIFFRGPGVNNTMVSNGGNGEPHTIGSFFRVGLRGVSTTAINSCNVERNDANVSLGTHSQNALPSSPVNFSVTVKCDSGSTGIQYGLAPGMENISKNVTDVLLLDPNMGSTAKGVAIEILNSAQSKIPLLNLPATGGVISSVNNWQSLPIPASGGPTSSVDVNLSARIVPYGNEPIAPGVVRSKVTFMLNKN